jgi:hypothetical protein
MDNTSALVREHDEDKQQPPRCRRDHEEVCRHNLVDVIG